MAKTLTPIPLPEGVTATDYGSLDAWLAARSDFIGASESPALCGVGYASQSPYSVWTTKGPGGVPDQLEGEQLECGKVLQPAILELASRRLGMQIYDPGEFTVYRSAERPFVGTTLDGIARDRDGVPCTVECKNVAGYNAADWQGDEPPLRVNVQIQHQCFAAGLGRGYAVGLLGGNRVICKCVQRDERFIKALVSRLDAFWELVGSRTPPPIDASEATTEALKRLYPSSNGETIDLPAEADKWDRSLQKAKARIKRWGALKREAENRLKASIGDAEAGLLPSGSIYTYWNQVTEYKAREAYTATYRILRRKGT